jgi:uncharacterized integral membrane protein
VRVALVIVALLATVFALSNTMAVTVMFLRWPIYTGPLALTIIGTGVLGALLMYLMYVPSMVRHARLRKHVQELERRLAAHHPVDTPPAAPDTSPSEIGQTRRLS